MLTKDSLKGEQLVFYSNDEIAAIQTLDHNPYQRKP